MTQDHSHDPRLLWLLPRVDKECTAAVEGMLQSITEQLAVATADGVSVRALSADGQSLLPLTAYHPDPRIGAAMAAVMAKTVQPADIGLWSPVMKELKPRRWRIDPRQRPPEASAAQAAFFEQFPVRAILVVPVVLDDHAVGGVSVARFSADREFTDEDEALAVAFSRRIAPALDFRNRVAELAASR